MRRAIGEPTHGVVERQSAPSLRRSSGEELADAMAPPFQRTTCRLPPAEVNDGVDRADVSRHGSRLSPEQLRALRDGRGTTVHGEILSEHVVRALNQQLHHHSHDDIRRSLEKISGPRPTVEQIYELVTQYGSIKQLHRLAECISERCGSADGPALYSPGDTSLAAAVRYLGVNKSILPVDWKVRTISRVEPAAVVILDETVLARMRSDPSFVRELIEAKATILSPLGFLKGVTPFRTLNLGEVEARIGSVVSQADIYAADPPEEVERKVLEVMRLEVYSRLHRIDPDLCEQVEFVAARLAPGEDAVARIAHQLNGAGGMSVESLEYTLGYFDPHYRPIIKDLLVQHAHVHSHISLGAAAREHGALVTQLATARGVDIEDIAFHCPEPNKSFSMYGMIFRESNSEFPTSSFTTPANLRRWLDDRRDCSRLVVILDDYAGSGESLLRTIASTRAIAPDLADADLIVSPLLATEVSVEMLRCARAAAGSVVMPVAVHSRIIDSVAYRTASPDIQLAQRAALGELGFAEVGTMVSLPYMSPDNDAEIFTQCFAEYYTLSAGAVRNRNQGAAKYGAKIQGPPFEVMCEQVDEKLRHTRHVAGLLPTLKSLLEREQEVRQYWRNLPEEIRSACETAWRKTEHTFQEERPVTVYTQLRQIRDVLDSSAVSQKDRLRFALDFKELEAAAATVELKPEVQRAIAECRELPALRRLTASTPTER